MNEARSSAQHGAQRFLTLFLSAEEYGIEILRVQEIIRLVPITRVPRMPDFIGGVINLRGRIVPVIELRRRLGLGPVEVSRETCIVVVRSAALLLGLLVDRVHEVLEAKPEQIDAVPDFGTSIDTDFLTGLAKHGDRVVLLLNMDRVLTQREAEALGPVA